MLNARQIQDLNNINVTTQKIKFGELFDKCLDEHIEMDKIAHQENSNAGSIEELRNDFNALLAKLRASKIMA